MKRFLLSLIAACSFSVLASSPALADTKVGVLDMQQLMQQMPQMKQIGDDLKKKFGDREKQINEAQDTLRKSADDFKRNNAVMSATDKQATADKLMKQQQDLQQMQQQFQKDFMVEQNKQVDGLLQKVKAVVQKVAEKNQMAVVLTNAAYADKSLDVTNQVLAEMKK